MSDTEAQAQLALAKLQAQREAIAAHIEIQTKVKDPERTKKGQIGKRTYYYAPLDSFVAGFRSILSDHNCFIRQQVVFHTMGDTVLKLWRTETVHAGGGSVATDIPYPANMAKDPQEQGSEITYLRRYGLLNHFNLAQDDDDGQAASRPTSNQERRQETPAARTQRQAEHHESWTEQERKRFMARLGELDIPNVKGKTPYDVLVTYAASKNWPRPSKLPADKREGMLRWAGSQKGRDDLYGFFRAGDSFDLVPDGDPNEWAGPPH